MTALRGADGPPAWGAPRGVDGPPAWGALHGVDGPPAWGALRGADGPPAWGAVRVDGRPPRPAVRLGGEVVLLAPLARGGALGAVDPELARALATPRLNALIELGPAVWRALLLRVCALAADDAIPAATRIPLAAAEPVLPVRVPDFVDFYASREHATSFGRLLRPGQPPLRPNWEHLPVAYHGRSSSIVVSGSDVRRPAGQVALGRLAPTAQLDVECELGYVCGPSVRGPLHVDRADEHVFGVVLVNDWSARDVQRVEQEPLGPFLGKSFATSMSAWITPLDALRAARVAPPAREPAPYLRASDPWLLAVELELVLDGAVVSRPPAAQLRWTPAQMLAHLTVNGATLSAGDLVATGTISGAAPGTEGSLAERFGGERWLRDGDEVVLRGRAGDVELGEVRGRVVAA